MEESNVSRREFHTLAAAAVGGAITGSMAGCGETPKKADSGKNGKDEKKPENKKDAPDPTLLTKEPHVCHGLNTCAKKDKTKDNACAGRGTCATAKAHTCHYENECRGQGGCEETAGQNSCQKKGNCGVPLSEETWKKARAAFEAQMKKEGKKFGPAPLKK